MRNIPRRSAVVVLLALVASLVGVITPQAARADVVPELQHAPITAGTNYDADLVAGPPGTLTVPCSHSAIATNLKTYDASGQLIQNIPVSPRVDGVDNCIWYPVVGKDGAVYGIPMGDMDDGEWGWGPNLLAYSGNTLKWKYPLSCMSGRYTIGADGNIYVVQRQDDGDHLIGLTPEVAPPATQPAKVMDVKVPDACSGSTPVAYKDGIMLREYGGMSRFYSYGGQYLGRSSIGSVYSKVNADGRLFVQSYVDGTVMSGNISMYDPLTKKVLWSTQASTPGASTYGIWLTPLATGGVAALVWEWKMDAPGVPASPRQRVDTLVVINAAGQKVKAIQLPKADSQGNEYRSTHLAADSSGKVIVMRKMAMGGYDTWPAISIGVYDPASDTWPYAKTMEGRPNDINNRYGYDLYSDSESGTAQPTSNTLNFLAKCQGKCPNSDYNVKVYSLKVTGLGTEPAMGNAERAASGVLRGAGRLLLLWRGSRPVRGWDGNHGY
jgi:hypothetical protein